VKIKAILVSIILVVSFVLAGTVSNAGLRIGFYSGWKPFPTPIKWYNGIKGIANAFSGSKASTIWTVGDLESSNVLHLRFPKPSGTFTKITFAKVDSSESHLDLFDSLGVTVFLGIEPSNADIPTAIKLTLDQYKHHPCVAGLSIDCEWVKFVQADDETPSSTPWGKPVTDQEAKSWEEAVKAYKSSYRLLLKHPATLPINFPPTYRGDIIFINDCEGRVKSPTEKGGFSSYSQFLTIMGDWADALAPSEVAFQYGYPSYTDTGKLFNSLSAPKLEIPKIVGKAIAEKCNSNQKVHLYWVDFNALNYISFETPTSAVQERLRKPFGNQSTLKPEKSSVTYFAIDGTRLSSIRGRAHAGVYIAKTVRAGTAGYTKMAIAAGYK
jgi:hypothetical protein